MNKRHFMKVECNCFPMEGREAYSLHIFGHTPSALIDIAYGSKHLTGGYAGDWGAISFYMDDDNCLRGILMQYWVTRSTIQTSNPDMARKWLAAAIRVCDKRNATIPQSIELGIETQETA